MRTILLLVALLVSLMVGWLGIRLLPRGLRERRAPEILLAIFFLGSGPFGFGLRVLARLWPGIGEEMFEGLRAAGTFGLLMPSVTSALFTWQVFRPGRRWAAGLGISLAAAILLSYAASLAAWPGQEAAFWTSYVIRLLSYAWTAYEALRYYVISRRRRALELCTALDVHRFLLWSLWASAAFSLHTSRFIKTLLLGTVVPTPSLQTLLHISLGILCGLAIWLLFYPPAFYQRLVAGSRDVEKTADRRWQPASVPKRSKGQRQ